MKIVTSLRRILRECLIARRQFSPCLPVLRRRLKLCHDYPCEMTTRCGLQFTAQTYHDLVTAWIIFCRSEYTPGRQSQLIVDLGANIGLFSLWASQHCPQAKIWAVEPIPESTARLIEHVERNSLSDRVQVVNKAVANSSGSRLMRSTGPSQSNGLQPPGTAASDEMVTVDAITLNDLLLSVLETTGRPMIDFLKIDVEGGEHEFIQSGAADALRHVNAVGIEYHPNGNKESLFSVLGAQGFQLTSDIVAHQNSGVAHFRRQHNATSYE